MNFRDKPSLKDLVQYGKPRRSGRYPWGSGDDPNQHTGDFLTRYDELREKGLTEKQIADHLGITTTEVRNQKNITRSERRALTYDTIIGLKEKGYTPTEIARQLGYNNESSIRSMLNQEAKERMNKAKNTAEFLKTQINEKGIIDVGAGIELELKVSKDKLNEALRILQDEGYPTYSGRVAQQTNPGKFTTVKVVCPPGTLHKEMFHLEDIHYITEYTSKDGGDTFDKFVFPKSMNSKRLEVRYAEDGGTDRDGLIELRRNVEDLSLGKSVYAQVRILVDDHKYIKGMAVYNDDLPDGIDVRFNTNKSKKLSKLETLKDIEKDPENPFGSLIKKDGQSYYTDKNGKKQLSLINKRAEEGDWGDWKDKLPSQFLSKQNKELIKKQLALTLADKQAEFDEICSLTNPTIKKELLKSFSDDCDAAAVHLKASSLPGQKYQVIIPIPTLKDNEVFAPNFTEGTQVALVRFPHGGTFEIPILTVNNKQRDALKVLGKNPKDAIGINKKNADRLSGADFDGDTAMVIPITNKLKITNKQSLKELEGFDSKFKYGPDPTLTKVDPDGTKHYFRGNKEIKIMRNTGIEMGKISNLINDMTLKGATDDELAKAVKHSMVVIDAEKHKLDYKQSEKDNDVAALKKKYQGYIDENGKYREGAGTLLSRSKSPIQVYKRTGQPWIDPDTGEYVWERINPHTGEFESKIKKEEYVDKKGKTKTRMQESTKMYETNDAYTLVSEARTPQELAYAEYANKMKSLGNNARKEMINTGLILYNKEANIKYKNEVAALDANVNIAKRNAPKERKAQILANITVEAKKKANPDLTKQELKKIKQQATDSARKTVGAKRHSFSITDLEWEAIQSGAISETKLRDIIKYVDIDSLKQRAMPRATNTLSEAQINKIKRMTAIGYTTDFIAESIGRSTATVSKYIKE